MIRSPSTADYRAAAPIIARAVLMTAETKQPLSVSVAIVVEDEGLNDSLVAAAAFLMTREISR